MTDDLRVERVGGYQVQVCVEEYYSMAETARLLHVHVRRIRELAARRDDPIPFRCFPGQQRGGFVHHDDLRDWIERNTVLLSECK